MDIREINNKDEWEIFLSKCSEKTFLHSWGWGEFNVKMGSKIWRLGAYSDNNLIATALIFKVSARRGTFLFIPHGPVFLGELPTKDKRDILELLLIYLSDIIKEEKASFVRISPILSKNEVNDAIFIDLGFRKAPIHMHPEVTWELDLTPSEDKILAGMRKTTRYLIKQAEKNPDIEIVKSTNPDDLKLFWPVYLKTAKRHHFTVFSERYLRAEMESFLDNNNIVIFLGKYKGEVISAAIFVIWQNMCFYHHSGSLTKFNKIPASYLLQWNAIKEAKNRGCKIYNFWGIAPDIKIDQDVKRSKHPWAGLSLFKMGFGGYRKDYISTQDLIVSKKYWINYWIEKIRKIKRGL